MKSLVLTMLLILSAAPAYAHKLKVFVTAEGGQVVGSVYFAGGDPAPSLQGQVLSADGQTVATITTDGDGGFRYTPPDGKAYRLHFQSADGHMAEAMIGAASAAAIATAPNPGANTTAMDEAALETALARQLRPLRQQIDALDGRTRLSDLIGGVGFIFGLFGCFAWVAAQRKAKASKP